MSHYKENEMSIYLYKMSYYYPPAPKKSIITYSDTFLNLVIKIFQVTETNHVIP